MEVVLEMFKRDLNMQIGWTQKQNMQHSTTQNQNGKHENILSYRLTHNTHTIEKKKISLGKDIVDWSLIFWNTSYIKIGTQNRLFQLPINGVNF